MALKREMVDCGVGKLLLRNQMTMSVCESCTGGMLSSVITCIPGSSQYFVGGIIAYSDRIKAKVVGVKKETLKRFGAVSAESAKEMALGVQKKLASDVGVAITGIAGPAGGTSEKPVGSVYIAVAVKRRMTVQRYSFNGGREEIRKAAVDAALILLRRTLDDSRIEQ